MSTETITWMWVLTGWVTTATALWHCFDEKRPGASLVALVLIVVNGAIIGPLGFIVLAYTKTRKPR